MVLAADSTSIGFAAFLKKEFLGFDLVYRQRAEVFSNCMFLHAIQFFMVLSILLYATGKDSFLKTPPIEPSILIARFAATVFMHVFVEKDVKNGLNMMKYSVNHRDHFVNPYASFVQGYALFQISVMVEINVMIVMTTIDNAMDVACKYISLAAIVNIPRLYFASIRDNRMLKCSSLKLPIKNIRADRPLEGAPCYIYLMRYLYKICRTIFCTLIFYFMPFIAIFGNFHFMISQHIME